MLLTTEARNKNNKFKNFGKIHLDSTLRGKNPVLTEYSRDNCSISPKMWTPLQTVNFAKKSDVQLKK